MIKTFVSSGSGLLPPNVKECARLSETIGLVIAVMGVSGTIDHLWRQPFLGPLLNAFNRYVIPRVDILAGYELYADLSLVVIGILVIMIAERLPEPS
jgi:hypothetical protein